MKTEAIGMLKLKTGCFGKAKKFCSGLTEYIRTDQDVQQFYENSGFSHGTFTNELSVSSSWNTGQCFMLRYVDATQTPMGIVVEFNFQLLKRKMIEECWQQDGKPFISIKHEFINTDLNFYVTYTEDDFTVKTDNKPSTKINDYEFIVDEIAFKLCEQLTEPPR